MIEAPPTREQLFQAVVAMELAAEAERSPERREALGAVAKWLRELYLGSRRERRVVAP